MRIIAVVELASEVFDHWLLMCTGDQQASRPLASHSTDPVSRVDAPSSRGGTRGKGLYSLLQEHQNEEAQAHSQQIHALPRDTSLQNPLSVPGHAHGSDQQHIQQQSQQHLVPSGAAAPMEVQPADDRMGMQRDDTDGSSPGHGSYLHSQLTHAPPGKAARQRNRLDRVPVAEPAEMLGMLTGRRHRRRSPSPERLSSDDGLETIHEYGNDAPSPPPGLIGSFTELNSSTFGGPWLDRWSAEYPPSLTVTASELPVSFADQSSSPCGVQYGRLSISSARDNIREEQSKAHPQSTDGQQTPPNSIRRQMPSLKPIHTRPPAKLAAKGVLSSMFMGCVGGKMPED